jgi:hypothetical protein
MGAGVFVMKVSGAQQAALYYARRRRLALSVMRKLTPWSEGIDVTAGQYVSSGDAPFVALHDGTTGPNAPFGQTFADGNDGSGGVTWVRADIQSLLQFLYKGVPTP